MSQKSYTMAEASNTARRGTTHVERYLRGLNSTISLQNVEEQAEYQNKDIDLIWTGDFKGKRETFTIEVKVDQYHHTGNYFFETFSNVERGSPGCFMYSQADYFFYYFLGIEIHAFKVAPARAWFIKNENRFQTRQTQTPVGDGNFYHTEGKLVNRSELGAALPDVVKVIRYSSRWDIDADKLQTIQSSPGSNQ